MKFKILKQAISLKQDAFTDSYKMLQLQTSLQQLPIELHNHFFDNQFITNCMKHTGNGQDEILISLLHDSVKYWSKLHTQLCVKHVLPILQMLCKPQNTIVRFETISFIMEIIDKAQFDPHISTEAYTFIEFILKDLIGRKQPELQQLLYVAFVHFQIKKKQLKQ